MDRFVIREPKIGADFPQGNQIIGFGSNTLRNSNMIPPESMFLGGYGREFPIHHAGSPGFYTIHQQISAPNFAHQPQSMNANNLHPGQAQMLSGIDPRYLAAYADGNASFIATGQSSGQMERPSAAMNFGGDYENRNFTTVERNKPKTLAMAPQVLPKAHSETKKPEEVFKEKSIYNQPASAAVNHNGGRREQFGSATSQSFSNVSHKSFKENVPEEKPAVKIMTRADKLKALLKTGPRAFTGPVEKVLKWHKALQEIGVLVIYEIVAKCVSVRPGESCAKNLVVRDDSGPAMQVVYYEIDFLLPEIKPPCTVRVIGRMMSGTCRLQAFNVRPATGDDVATLPRRAAVAAHHVAKLCKDYGISA